jgi:sulfide:quinone oxidoreductase
VDAAAGVIHTTAGGALAYDELVVACGASRHEAVDGAITFNGPPGRERVAALANELAAGRVSEVVFALPVDAGWSLPLYELALLTSARLEQVGRHASLSVVTPEREPLEILGPRAGEALRAQLAERGVGLMTGSVPVRFESGHLRLRDGCRLAADAVVALPSLAGPGIAGLPSDRDGFIATDEAGRVEGLEHVFAVGDATTMPIKQGGLATQQADAVAAAIARRAGAKVLPPEGDPVLRAVLLTGGEPRFLRATVTDAGIVGSMVSRRPLWQPASKVASRFLAPYLASLRAEAVVAQG